LEAIFMSDTTPKKEYRRNPDAREFKFAASPALAKKIVDISTKRFRSMSSTIRMLLYLGIEEYELAELSGNPTKAKREQELCLRRARAEADAAQRERRKRGENSPALTPVLFGDPGEDE
jgi:hypothetical protein